MPSTINPSGHYERRPCCETVPYASSAWRSPPHSRSPKRVDMEHSWVSKKFIIFTASLTCRQIHDTWWHDSRLNTSSGFAGADRPIPPWHASCNRQIICWVNSYHRINMPLFAVSSVDFNGHVEINLSQSTVSSDQRVTLSSYLSRYDILRRMHNPNFRMRKSVANVSSYSPWLYRTILWYLRILSRMQYSTHQFLFGMRMSVEIQVTSFCNIFYFESSHNFPGRQK